MIPAALILWGLGWLLLFRIKPCGTAGSAVAPPAVSVIIPARNEAANLPVLLDSLLAQSVAPAETWVVDDDSTDGTADVAKSHGAKVLVSSPLPDGWRGKTWACHQGALRAGGDLLCFVDADTWFATDGLKRVLREWQRRQGALSLAPWHDVRTWPEQLSAFFNLMMSVGIGAFTVLGDRIAPAGLFGPFLLVSRTAYEAAGGHAAVKDRILENVHMAACFKRAGIATTCRSGRGVLSIRMYSGGVRELRTGWAKAFASGAANTPAWLMAPAVAWMAGAIMAFIAPASSLVMPAMHSGPWVGVYLLYGLQFCFLMRRLGRFKGLTALFYPVSLMFYLVVFAGSFRVMKQGRSVDWKGRSIRAVAETKGSPHVD